MIGKFRPSKKRETVRPLAPKYEKGGKAETCAFRRQSRLRHFRWLSSAWLVKPFITQASDSWGMVTPPAYGRPPPGPHGRHGRPQPPSAASVGGGGALDRLTSRRYHQSVFGLVPIHPVGVKLSIFGY